MTYEAFHDALRDTRLPLNNGAGAMPAVGFGTLFRDLSTTTEAVKCALEVGFRHFDCAERYRNEEQIGVAFQQVFAAGLIRREDVFVTTKLWNTNHRPERVEAALEASCRRLQVDYIDCYLIHTPFAFQAGDDQDPRDVYGHVIYDGEVKLIDTWRATALVRLLLVKTRVFLAICWSQHWKRVLRLPVFPRSSLARCQHRPWLI